MSDGRDATATDAPERSREADHGHRERAARHERIQDAADHGGADEAIGQLLAALGDAGKRLLVELARALQGRRAADVLDQAQQWSGSGQ